MTAPLTVLACFAFYAMGVFAYVVSLLFSPAFYPESVVPSGVILLAALAIGWLVRKRDFNLWLLIAAAFALTLVAVLLSPLLPVRWDSVEGWTLVLLAYAYLASVLPVWRCWSCPSTSSSAADSHCHT